MRVWLRWMVGALAGSALLAGCAEQTQGVAVAPRGDEQPSPSASPPVRSTKPTTTSPSRPPRTSAPPKATEAPCDQLPAAELATIYGEALTMAKTSTSCRLNAGSGGYIWINVYTGTFAEEAAKEEGRDVTVVGLPARLTRFFGEIIVARSPDPNATTGTITISVKYLPRKDDATMERVRLAAAEKIAPVFRR
jgi:hypothetical protein